MRLLCWLRGTHGEAVRQPIGGFRCGRCGAAAADLGELPGWEGGYVRADRVQYRRDRDARGWRPRGGGR